METLKDELGMTKLNYLCGKKFFNHKKKQNMELFQKSFVFDKLQVRSPSQT